MSIKMALLLFVSAHVHPLTATNTTAGAISGSSIFNSIWNLMSGFFSSIMTQIENLLGDIFGGIGGAINNVFSNWGYSVSNTFGIWAPLGMIVILGVSGFVLYVFLDLYRGEKDVAEDEDDL